MPEPVERKYNPFFNQVDSREPDPYNVSIVGWEGDSCSVIISSRGSFYARMGEVWSHFGISDGIDSLTWENAEGWLPCLVTKFTRGDVTVEISHFCNKVNINGSDFSLLFSRVKKTNEGAPVAMPADPTNDLVRISPEPGTLATGATEVEDFVTPVDSFGKKIDWPAEDQLRAAGTWDENYRRMRGYWQGRINSLVRFEKLPDERLANAWRAGTVYQYIIMDGLQMNVGVNAYREEFSHDTIGMLVTLIQSGDLETSRKVLDAHRHRLVAPLDYPDGDYKYPWMWAVYLLKSGDEDFVRSNFWNIRAITRASASQRTGPGGVMRLSMALDNPSHWLVDDWSMLTGLAAYKVLSDKLGEHSEAKWAIEEYGKLLDACNKAIEEQRDKGCLEVLSPFMLHGIDPDRPINPKSASWATSMHMGRWPWESFVLGADQEGIMLDWIDPTYEYGINHTKEVLPPYIFGSWTGYCCAYNAGFGYGALRGDRFRDTGISGYQAMIEHAMSGPYSWWEGINEPDPDNAWRPNNHPRKGMGSCPHMWGDSFSRKLLIDATISEFADGRVIIGRGVPEEWLEPGQEIRVSNIPLQDNRRFGFAMTADKDSITFEFSGDVPIGEILLDLPGAVPTGVVVDGREEAAPGAWPVVVASGAKKVVLRRRL